MDELLKGVFESEHPQKVKKQILKKLRLSLSDGISRLPSERKQSLMRICFRHCLFGNEFEHQEAVLFLKEILSHYIILKRSLINSKFIEKLLVGSWVNEHFNIFVEEANGSSQQPCSSVIPTYRRIVLIELLVDACKKKSLTSELRIIQIHVMSDVIHLLYHSQDHQTFSEICRLITKHTDCMPALSRGFAMCSLSIHAMSEFFPLNSDKNTLTAYVKDIVHISLLIKHVWSLESVTLMPSLMEIFKIISSHNIEQPPSNALGCLVEFIPTNLVESTVQKIVNDETVSDEQMATALTCMVSWLGWPTQNKAHLWVLSFFKELERVSKFILLIDVTVKTVKQVFSCLRIPVVRSSALAVLIHMLLSFKHSPEAFHRILPLIPEVMSQLKEEGWEENVVYMKQISNLCHCMMQVHSGFPELYIPILEIIKVFPKPTKKDINAALHMTSWTSNQQFHYYNYNLQSRSPDTEKAGLVNLGNTCYINSVIQSLFIIDEFRVKVLSSLSTPSSITQCLEITFAHLLLTRRIAYEPLVLVEHSRPSWFETGAQQDCSEYLKHLLDCLHEEEKNKITSAAEGIRSDSTSATKQPTTSIPSTCDRTEASFVKKLFHGKLRTNIRCDSCGFVSSREETFVDIALPLNQAHERGAEIGRSGSTQVTQVGPVPNNMPTDSAMHKVSSESNMEISKSSTATTSTSSYEGSSKAFIEQADEIEDLRLPIQVEGDDEDLDEGAIRRHHELANLLRNYLEEEKLEGDNKYYCTRCNSLRNAAKTTVIVALPKYLIITLMRFTYDTTHQIRTKIMDNVEIPQEIQVPTVNESGEQLTKRSLCAVIVHSGTSANSGHYYCYAKQWGAQGDNWFLFNDSHVSPATFSSIKELTSSFARDTAYVLLYKRENESLESRIDGKEYIKHELLLNIEEDNVKFLKDMEEASKREAAMACSMPSNVLGWNDDNNPPPPPTCGGGGDGPISSNQFVF